MVDKILTARQLGERYGVAASTARAWCLSGLIPGAYLEETAVGSFWMIPEKALARFTVPKRGPKAKVLPTAGKTPKGRRVLATSAKTPKGRKVLPKVGKTAKRKR
jgi:hypothetical protein